MSAIPAPHVLSDKKDGQGSTASRKPDPAIPNLAALSNGNLEAELASPSIVLPPEAVGEFADRINAANKRMGSNFKELCLLAAEAARKIEERSPERHNLYAKLDFSPSKFSMLAKIGAAPHLFDPKYENWLPPVEEYSKSYQLAFLAQPQLDEAIMSQKVHPETTQLEAARVKNEYVPKVHSASARLAARKRAAKAERAKAATEGKAPAAKIAEPNQEALEPFGTLWIPHRTTPEQRAWLNAQYVEMRQRVPGSKVVQPLVDAKEGYRKEILRIVLNVAVAKRGQLLREKEGQPDHDQFEAETDFDYKTPLPEIARKLAPHVDLEAILADAEKHVTLPPVFADPRVPPSVGERVRAEVLAEFAATLRTEGNDRHEEAEECPDQGAMEEAPAQAKPECG